MTNLTIPKGKIDVVIDTAIAVGYYMECDEQFAIGYMLKQDKFDIKAFYLELTVDDHWLSCRRTGVTDLLDATGRKDLYSVITKGGTRRLELGNPEKSEPALDLIERSKNYSAQKPLYVFAIGPLTNVGTALTLDPTLAQRIVVVWVGGHSFDSPDTAEYNLICDLEASNTVLKSDTPLILIPCKGVSEKLKVGAVEFEKNCLGRNELCNYISDYLHKMAPEQKKFDKMVRIIWDGVAGPLFTQKEQELVQYKICDRPYITEDKRWAFVNDGRKIIYVYDIDPERVKEDMLKAL